MIFEVAYAQAQDGGVGGLVGAIFPLLLMIPIFYFLIIRPQQKKMKQHNEMLQSIQRGDEIVTSGGLIGKVIRVKDGELSVEITEDVKVRVVQSMVSTVRSKTEPRPAKDQDQKDEKKT